MLEAPPKPAQKPKNQPKDKRKKQCKRILEYHFKHDLEYKQAVEVYDLATESEKDVLKPLLNQKRYNLLKRGRVSEVEEEQPQ